MVNLEKELFFITKLADLDKISKNLINEKNIKLISFFNSFEFLQKKKINFYYADDYLSKEERLKIFEKAAYLSDWHKYDEAFKVFNFHNVNLLSLIDSLEFHQFLIEQMIIFQTMINIINKENPKKITLPKFLYNGISDILNENKFKVSIIDTDDTQSMYWEKFTYKFQFFNKSFNFSITRKNYFKTKKFIEKLIFYNKKFKVSKENRNSILFIDYDILSYKNLFKNLLNNDFKIYVLNKRRPLFYNFSTLKYLLNLNCKIIFLDDLYNNSNFDTKILDFYLKELKILWEQNNIFEKIFSINDNSFWNFIKEKLFSIFQQRMENFIIDVISFENLFNEFNFENIIVSNILGDNEKIIQQVKNVKTDLIMLEHGYANYVSSIKSYDFLSCYPHIKEKIAVWGITQKKYLQDFHSINENQILNVGSPRHDKFFNTKKLSLNEKNILITIHPISNVTGKLTVHEKIKLQNLLLDLLKLIQVIGNYKIIIKPHPGIFEYEKNLLNLAKLKFPDIILKSNSPIIELLKRTDSLINISPEGMDPSTVLLEAMILKVPIMNLILDNSIYDFQFVKDESIFNLISFDKLEKNLKYFLFDEFFRNKLISNSQNHLKNYLSNPGNSCECFSRILKKNYDFSN